MTLKHLITAVFLCFPLGLLAQKQIIPPGKLCMVGTYYYPEHWPEAQWERDIKRIADMGFEFTHFAEFAWAQLEPEEGKFDFSWLDKAVALAEKNGLKVVMCTPTPTPPRWLSYKHPEILMVNDEGRTIQHGARTHASWSSDVYRDYIKKIVEQLGERYGNNPAIMGWQIDNEPSHYRSPWDYSEAAEQKFRQWLKQKYGSIQQLNQTWGADFWSQNYNSFEQIRIPNQKELVQQANPHAVLDFRRFTADEAAGFVSFQADLLRPYVRAEQWITTNYMPGYISVDPRKSKDLDFVTYTRYLVAGFDSGHGPQGFRMGSAAGIGLASDFFRTITGTTGIMELQPGQVNWGKFNPQPMPGAVRMWLWHAFSAGSVLACNYRFRHPLYGGEQYHYGMLKPDGETISSGGEAYKQFMEELNMLRQKTKAAAEPKDLSARRVAVLYDLNSRFEEDYQPQTSRWSYMGHLERYYNGLKSLGAPVDVIDEAADFSQYPFMIVPAFQLVDEALVARWQAYAERGGHLIISTRSGQKNREAHLWEGPWAMPVARLIGSEIAFYDHLPENISSSVKLGDKLFEWNTWGEVLLPGKGVKTLAVYQDQFYKGGAAVVKRSLGKGSVTYIGVDSNDGSFEKAVLAQVYKEAGVGVLDLPPGVVLNWRDGFWVAVNYSSVEAQIPLPKGAEVLIGKATLPPAGVLVWR
jgi:beta-galactosidase